MRKGSVTIGEGFICPFCPYIQNLTFRPDLFLSVILSKL
jgi:hypothetical protein